MFVTRFGHGGTLGEDDYPSILKAIRAKKNKIKNKLRGSTRPLKDKETHNNQPKYSVSDGGRLCDEIRPWRNVWREWITSFGVANEATKNKEIYQIVILGGRRTTVLHNNQPKICRNDGGGIIKDALSGGEVRGARLHQLRGDWVGRRLKNELK